MPHLKWFALRESDLLTFSLRFGHKICKGHSTSEAAVSTYNDRHVTKALMLLHTPQLSLPCACVILIFANIFLDVDVNKRRLIRIIRLIRILFGRSYSYIMFEFYVEGPTLSMQTTGTKFLINFLTAFVQFRCLTSNDRHSSYVFEIKKSNNKDFKNQCSFSL